MLKCPFQLNDYDDFELFLQNGSPKKGIKAYFKPEIMLNHWAVRNLWQAPSRI